MKVKTIKKYLVAHEITQLLPTAFQQFLRYFEVDLEFFALFQNFYSTICVGNATDVLWSRLENTALVSSTT
jgi:hypothetical protein